MMVTILLSTFHGLWLKLMKVTNFIPFYKGERSRVKAMTGAIRVKMTVERDNAEKKKVAQ